MNDKHLLYYLFHYMEQCNMNLPAMIEWFEMYKYTFSDNPQPGEITVAAAIEERYHAYRKARLGVNG